MRWRWSSFFAVLGVYEVNASLAGPLSLSDTRTDLDEQGAARMKTKALP